MTSTKTNGSKRRVIFYVLKFAPKFCMGTVLVLIAKISDSFVNKINDMKLIMLTGLWIIERKYGWFSTLRVLFRPKYNGLYIA